MPITGRLPNPGVLSGVLLTNHQSAKLYDGEYIVIPSAHENQVLNTSNTFLKQDVVVTIIPTYATSNDSGTTFIIGD